MFTMLISWLRSLVIDFLEVHTELNNDIGVAYFYFDYQNRAVISKVLMTLLRQLSLRKELIPDEVRNVLDAPNSLDLPGFAQAEAALKAILSYFIETFIILDGLDECDSSNQQDLIQIIRSLKTAQCKLLAASRDEKWIRDLFHDCPKKELSAKDDDIDRFVRTRLLENPYVKSMTDQYLQSVISMKISERAENT